MGRVEAYRESAAGLNNGVETAWISNRNFTRAAIRIFLRSDFACLFVAQVSAVKTDAFVDHT